MTVYGYTRVSTQDQDLGGQVTELLAAGCNKIFQEKVSGITECAGRAPRTWSPSCNINIK
jgi:DNA invertase Pin-like site-specific DNA recombinase